MSYDVGETMLDRRKRNVWVENATPEYIRVLADGEFILELDYPEADKLRDALDIWAACEGRDDPAPISAEEARLNKLARQICLDCGHNPDTPVLLGVRPELIVMGSRHTYARPGDAPVALWTLFQALARTVSRYLEEPK